jgi:hypothetical protein
MVEKVTAAGDEVTPAPAALKTEEKPPVPVTPTTPQVDQGPGGGSPSMAGPLDHLYIGGSTMADPDGHCRVCGKPCEGRLCPNCFENPESWNAKVKDFYDRAKAAGWNDNQIRLGAEDFFRQVKAEAEAAGDQSKYAQGYKCAALAQVFINDPPGFVMAH